MSSVRPVEHWTDKHDELWTSSSIRPVQWLSISLKTSKIPIANEIRRVSLNLPSALPQLQMRPVEHESRRDLGTRSAPSHCSDTPYRSGNNSVGGGLTSTNMPNSGTGSK
jgi:hypothetical protein